MRSSALAISIALSACVHSHPVGALERQAHKQDKAWAAAPSTAKEDGLYWVQRTEALAVAVEAVQTFAPLVEVDPDRVRSDWVYTQDAGIEDAGEWHSQERTRITAEITGELELGLKLFKRTEARRIRAGLDPSGWGGGDAPWTPEEALQALAGLEAEHLSRLDLDGEEERLRRVATELSPKDYGVVVDEPGRLVVERNVTEGRSSKDGSKTAAWHSRSQIELLISMGNAVDVQVRADHRFDTEKGPGEWQPAEAVDLQTARDWVKRMLAEPRSGLKISEAKRSAPAEVDREETQPPAVPRLRSMPEIQTLIANRAIETSSGDFRVCLAGALLPVANPAKGYWDPDPADPTAAPLARGGPRTAEEALGRVRGIKRTIEPLPDLLQVARQIPVIERKDAAAALRDQAKAFEAAQHDFTSLRLPAHPDVGGRLEAGAKATLEVVPDRLVASWDSACIDKRFKNGLPNLSIALTDAEAEGADEPIAACDLDLATVLTQGDLGVACGEARVFLDATYLFDMPQIELVGLPAAGE